MLCRLAVLACLASFAVFVFAADEKLSPEESKALAALKRIQDRAGTGSVDAAKLRQELFGFRLAHLGTKAAVKAAEMLAELPSPLDRMDHKTIAEIEKFPGQPKELVGILGEHRGRVGGAVTGVAFSSDNESILSGGGQYVRMWNAATMRLLGVGGHAYVNCVALSKDGTFAVSGGIYGTVYIWDVNKGELKLRFQIAAATSQVHGVACHPDNKLIACALFDNTIRLYDVSGKEAKDVGLISGHTKAVRCVAFAPDGKTLASGSEDLTARVWDATSSEYKEKSRMEGHETPVLSVAFTRKGDTLATGCADGSIRLWNLPAAAKPKAPRVQFQGPKGAVSSLAFSGTASTLAATCGDASVRLWNLSGGKLVKERFKLDGHAQTATAVAYSPDMKLLVSGGDDWTVRTWDLSKAKPAERFVPGSHLSHVYSLAFATDSATVASGSYDRVVRFWDLARAEPKTRNYLKFDVPVYAVAYSPDGQMVAAGGQTTTIKQWGATSGKTRPTLKNNPSYVYHLTYSPDSKYLLAASGKDVILYNAAQGGEARRFTPHKTNITCIGFSPDAKRVLSGSGFYLYDDKNRIVTKDGKQVYTDCFLKVWDLEKDEPATQAPEAMTPFYAASFSADGSTLYAGNYEAALRRFAYRADKLSESPPWKGTHSYVHGIWPTPDGKYVLTRGMDGMLTLWESASGKRLKDWTFSEQMGGVAVSADSRHIAVGLGTGVIYVLRIAEATRK